MSQIIGLDVGTNSAKALMLAGDKIVAQHNIDFAPDCLGGGFVEQDPTVWWEAAREAIKAVTATCPGKVTALATAGQMHSSVFLDSAGQVVRPAILWNDTRTTEQTKVITELAGGEAALLRMIQNRALEGFTLPKILWLKEHEPQHFAQVTKVVMPKDYINYKLTGRVATDISDAAGTICFDVAKKRWNAELMGKMGLCADILPEVLESVDAVGTVLPELAAELGLSPETLVITGGADNSCAAIGNGVVAPGQTVISIGTSGTVVTMLDHMPQDITGDVHLFNYSCPGSFYAMGCMLCAGESLNWLRSIVGVDDFDTFNELARQSAPGAGGVVFLPYLFGERCPVNNPAACGMFFGLRATTTKADMVRAVMEGVAFNIKAMFELVAPLAEISDIYITGGGAKSGIWGQIIADILGRSIAVLNIEQGPAFGAALIAGIGAGVFGSFEEAKEKFLTTTKTIIPEAHEAYPRQFELFKQLYEANRALF